MPSPEEAIREYREGLRLREAAILADLTRRYALVERDLVAQAQRLAEQIAQQGTPTLGQLAADARIRALLAQTRAELDALAARAVPAVVHEQAVMLGLGEQQARALVELASGVALQSDAAIAALSLLQPNAPLSLLFAAVPEQAQEALRDALFSGLALGQSPDVVAQAITKALGIALVRSMAIARTEMLRAYRTGAIEQYRRNRDVVRGWVWVSARDRRTCPMCWAMHGTEHSLDELFASHVSCRCTMAPIVDGGPVVAAGTETFGRLPAETQAEILGPAKYAGWRRGLFDLADVVGERTHPVWGHTRYLRTLDDLVGDAAARELRRAA